MARRYVYDDEDENIPFEVGLRNLNAEKHWEKIDLDNYKIEKPMLICLGGNGSVETRDANGICKIFENMIGLKKQRTHEVATKNDVDVMGFVYSKRLKSSEVGRLKEKDCKTIVEKLFMPLFRDESGSRLACEQAMKNANMLNFATHCYGTTVLKDFLNIMEDNIYDLGYSADEAQKIFSQMVAVNYVPQTATDKIPNLQIYSGSDFNGIPCYSSDFLRGIFYEFFDKTYNDNKVYDNTVFKENNSVILLTTNMLKVHYGNDDHFLECLERDPENWQSVPANGYFADIVSKATSYVLANSIANSIENCNQETFTPKMTVDDILQSSKDILQKNQTDIEVLANELI